MITEVAKATGSSLIDVNATTSESGNKFYADGIHPTVDGAAVIAQAVYDNLP